MEDRRNKVDTELEGWFNSLPGTGSYEDWARRYDEHMKKRIAGVVDTIPVGNARILGESTSLIIFDEGDEG